MEKTFSERVTEAKQAVSAISVREAADLRHGCEPVVFVDPRPVDAIAATGLIRGAKNVSLDDIASGKLPPELGDKWTRIVTSCKAGPLAAIAAHELTRLGFGRVSYLDGGTQAWLDAGLPTDPV